MKHNLEEHILSPGLEESSIKWIRHVSCSQIYENAILFFWLVILNFFLNGGQGNKTSLFANTFSNHSFVWKTTSFCVRFPKSIFFFFSPQSSEDSNHNDESPQEEEGFMGMSPLLQAHHAMERMEEFVCKVRVCGNCQGNFLVQELPVDNRLCVQQQYC